jgi:hypothetical protein
MSCLFNSFSRFVGESPQTIRQKICDYLATNPSLYQDISASEAILADYGKDGNLEAYVARMRSPSTMGGGTEIRAFVNLWKRPVIINSCPNKRQIEFICNLSNQGAPVKLNWTGGHYSPA